MDPPKWTKKDFPEVTKSFHNYMVKVCHEPISGPYNYMVRVCHELISGPYNIT
jgi:hypothetical protein